MSVVDALASWQTVGAVGGFVGLIGLVEAALYFSRKTKTYRLTGANGAKMEVTLAKGLSAAERDRLLHLAAHLPAATGTRHALPPGILVLTRR